MPGPAWLNGCSKWKAIYPSVGMPPQKSPVEASQGSRKRSTLRNTGQLAVKGLTLMKSEATRVAKESLVLKILVSGVRFRPGPPRTLQRERQPMQVGVIVSTEDSQLPHFS